jgi:hypothetical protein
MIIKTNCFKNCWFRRFLLVESDSVYCQCYGLAHENGKILMATSCATWSSHSSSLRSYAIWNTLCPGVSVVVSYSVGLAEIDTPVTLGNWRSVSNQLSASKVAAPAERAVNIAPNKSRAFRPSAIILFSLGLKSLTLACESATELCPV